MTHSDGSAKEAFEIFLDTRVFCKASKQPGVLAIGKPGAGTVPIFTSLEVMARYQAMKGEAKVLTWFSTSGKDLIELLPAGYALLIDPGTDHTVRFGCRHRIERFLQMYVGIPALTALTGGLPGRVLGGHSLPRGVADQWARWSRRPGFLTADDTSGTLPPDQRFTGPLTTVYIPSDSYAPFSMHTWLHSLYPHADARAVLLPDSYRNLGHFGAFRPAADRLWAQAWQWLRSTGSGLRPGSGCAPPPHAKFPARMS